MLYEFARTTESIESLNNQIQPDVFSMKLGFICLNIQGHLNPMTALARQLQGRGHDVVFLYSRGGAGLPFVLGDETDHFNENRPQISRMQGEDALKYSVRG